MVRNSQRQRLPDRMEIFLMEQPDACNDSFLGIVRISSEKGQIPFRFSPDGFTRRIYVSRQHNLHTYGR